MTVSTTTITSGPYSGAGTTDTFSYTFRVENKTQLKVYETDDAAVQTLLTVDTDYTVNNIGTDGGGTITRVAGNLPLNYEWYIRSDYKLTQLTEFASQGSFLPEIHEAAMDKMTFLIQQQQDGIDRNFRLSDTIPVDGTFTIDQDAATRADKVLGFDTSGDLVATTTFTAGSVNQIDLDQRHDVTFATVATMVSVSPVDVAGNPVTPQVGATLRTQGYYTAGDGGGNSYLVVAAATGTDDGGSFIDLTTHQAQALFPLGQIFDKHFGVRRDGITDDTLAIQAAINYVKNLNSTLRLTSGDLRATSPLIIDKPLSIVGIGVTPFITSIGNRGQGSWFHFDHFGIGIDITNAAIFGTVVLDKFGTFRSQPTPAPAWIPAAFDFDINIRLADVIIGEIMLYNPTKGLRKETGGFFDRLIIGTIRGQPLLIGIDIDAQLSPLNINIIDFGLFWSNSFDVTDSMSVNVDGVVLKHVVSPIIQSIYINYASQAMRIQKGTSQSVSNLQIGNASFTNVRNGLFFESDLTTGASGQISNMYIKASNTALFGNGIFFGGGQDVKFDITNLKIVDAYDSSIAMINGTGHVFRIGRFTNEGYDRVNIGLASIVVDINNTIRFNEVPLISGQGGGVENFYSGAGEIRAPVDEGNFSGVVGGGGIVAISFGPVTRVVPNRVFIQINTDSPIIPVVINKGIGSFSVKFYTDTGALYTASVDFDWRVEV